MSFIFMPTFLIGRVAGATALDLEYLTLNNYFW